MFGRSFFIDIPLVCGWCLFDYNLNDRIISQHFAMIKIRIAAAQVRSTKEDKSENTRRGGGQNIGCDGDRANHRR